MAARLLVLNHRYFCRKDVAMNTESCPLEWLYLVLCFTRSALLVLWEEEQDWGGV
jgi:hypothetical protein